MKIHQIATIALFLIFSCSETQASIVSDVWTTGVSGPADGAFGTSGSVLGNTLAATIGTGSIIANVGLSADNDAFFRTTGNVTNDELAPFFENDAPLTRLTFSTDQVLTNFDVLVHNVWHSADGNQNYIGRFTVTYADGTIVQNAVPTVRSIFDDSPFEIDFDNDTVQPTGLADDFDGANLLSLSDPAFDPGNDAPLGYYLSDESQSAFSEEQGSAILSFDESIHGGITGLDFFWVGHTVGSNTAFIGFAGTAVPEPSAFAFLALGSVLCLRRRRR